MRKKKGNHWLNPRVPFKQATDMNLSKQVGTALALPKDTNPFTSTPNFFEETQIAKIYGMTEDYTPPRRVRTAFMIYSEHKKEEVLEEQPNIKEPELLREIARCWSHIDNDSK